MSKDLDEVIRDAIFNHLGNDISEEEYCRKASEALHGELEGQEMRLHELEQENQ